MRIHTTLKHSALPNLMDAISSLKNQEEALQFFTDLCAPAELEAMADRWQVVTLLRQGIPYRTIHEQTGVRSLEKIKCYFIAWIAVSLRRSDLRKSAGVVALH